MVDGEGFQDGGHFSYQCQVSGQQRLLAHGNLDAVSNGKEEKYHCSCADREKEFSRCKEQQQDA